MFSEFDLIERYFSRAAPAGLLGVGDDCALLPVAPGMQLAASTDLLLEGRHFLPGSEPNALGHKALAVNLSDLAAMGAQPVACLLGLSLPAIDHEWLSAFSDGFYALADQSGCALIGGDTTRSVSGIVISVTVFGQVRSGHALLRSAARSGDDVWVSGTLGAAFVALLLLQNKLPFNAPLLAATRHALERPMPPWRFAQELVDVAHAALDISDGLLQDLGHILKASHCGAELNYDALPLDPALDSLPAALQQSAALAGGDVYQLCFTAPDGERDRILALAANSGIRATRIGRVTAQTGLTVLAANGARMAPASAGFDHFA